MVETLFVLLKLDSRQEHDTTRLSLILDRWPETSREGEAAHVLRFGSSQFAPRISAVFIVRLSNREDQSKGISPRSSASTCRAFQTQLLYSVSTMPPCYPPAHSALNPTFPPE